MDKNRQAFFELLRAGLWEDDARLLQYSVIDYSAIIQMAEDQSLVGLITAGLEKVIDTKIPKEELLQFIGQTIQLEQQNKNMNAFIERLFETFRSEGIFSILVKGQGIAQCYERPLWRACGDVDLLLNKENYRKAQKLLLPLAYDIEAENSVNFHQAMSIDRWCVELHGLLHSGLGSEIDSVIDEIQEETFRNKQVRTWYNGKTDVLLPASDNDVVFVFAHILQHFFGGGIGLRQVCDWCRLLWTYHKKIDVALLESRLKRMGLMPQWQAFAALAVNTLGMPAEAMPLYSSEKKWGKKAEKILRLILESGNFGHGRDQSYKNKYPKLIEYAISFWVFTRYGIRQFMIFPSDAVRGWMRTISLGVKAKMKR